MILIADSGSTKTHITILDRKSIVKSIYMPGLNPFYQTESQISQIINENLSYLTNIDCIYFFCAGCSFIGKKIILKNALSYLFPKADIFVESDLLAACKALFGDKDGIACILGTGSNSCSYINGKIEKNVSPLGYILGDEGSGAVLGKKLVANCLKQIYSKNIEQDFYNKFSINPTIIMDKVYKESFPNRFLASLVPFIVENIHKAEMQDLVYSSFNDFFVRNVLQYEKNKDLPLGFVGSISYQFQNILQEVALKHSFVIKQIYKEPMEGLISYYSK